MELERDEPRSEFQAPQGVVEQDKGIKLNRRHSRFRRGPAVSGNPAGAESSKILSRTAEQARLEGCEELSGVWGRRIRRRTVRDTGDAEVLPTDPGRRESDKVNAERVPDFVHCDRSYPRRKSPTKHGCPRPETQSHRNGIKGISLGPRREGGDHQRKSERFFASRGQHSSSRVEARKEPELGTAEQRVERRFGAEGAEGNKRKGERSSQRERATRGAQDGSSKANVLSESSKAQGKLSQFSGRVFEGSLPEQRELVAGSSQDSILPRATVLSQQDRKGTNDSFLGSSLSGAGSLMVDRPKCFAFETNSKVNVPGDACQESFEATPARCTSKLTLPTGLGWQSPARGLRR